MRLRRMRMFSTVTQLSSARLLSLRAMPVAVYVDSKQREVIQREHAAAARLQAMRRGQLARRESRFGLVAEQDDNDDDSDDDDGSSSDDQEDEVLDPYEEEEIKACASVAPATALGSSRSVPRSCRFAEDEMDDEPLGRHAVRVRHDGSIRSSLRSSSSLPDLGVAAHDGHGSVRSVSSLGNTASQEAHYGWRATTTAGRIHVLPRARFERPTYEPLWTKRASRHLNSTRDFTVPALQSHVMVKPTQFPIRRPPRPATALAVALRSASVPILLHSTQPSRQWSAARLRDSGSHQYAIVQEPDSKHWRSPYRFPARV